MADVTEQLNHAEWESLNPAVDDSNPQTEPVDDGPDYMSMPAPHGRFKNGRPRKTPVGKPASRGKKKTAAPQYFDGIMGLLQVTSVGLMMASGGNNKPLLADSAAIAEYGPNVAQSLDALAQERPEIAAVLDKILAVGPYGLVLGAVVPLFMQIASNHGVKIPNMPNAEEYLTAVESERKTP